MRGPLRKELIACFKREFQPRFHQFVTFQADGGFWWWTWKIAPNLSFFVALQAFGRKDQFVVEIAWSDDGKFPWHGSGQIDVDQPQGRDRLGRLWKSGPDEPVWDMAPEATAALEEDIKSLARGESPKRLPDPPIEQILPRIGPLVHDALDKLEQYGRPIFRRVAEAHGIKWPEA
jgi:hypothetical protein